MISEKLINAIVKKQEFNSKVIFEVIKHIQNNYDMGNNKTFHFLEMLVDPNSIVTEKDINMVFVKDNISDYIYDYINKNVRNVSIEKVDNIDCTVHFNYEYSPKSSENDDNITWNTNCFTLSFIDYPKVLKNS